MKIQATIIVLLAALLFPLSAGAAATHTCRATGALGSRSSCTVSPSSTGVCTVDTAFVRFNAGCSLCTLSSLRCDITSGSKDLRVDLYTTGTNYTDSATLPGRFKGVTGGAIAIGCTNTDVDVIEVSIAASCS